MTKKLPNLPKSDDDEYWEEDAEKYTSQGKPVAICDTHGKLNWTEHVGYIDNHDGTALCKFCNWGFRIPGYMRIFEGKVFDLRVE